MNTDFYTSSFGCYFAALLASFCILPVNADPPSAIIDLANQTTSTGTLHRVLGSAGNGHFGVPVAGGFDIDGDGFKDSAFSAMRASPSGRPDAGQVHLVLGDGTINGTLDTAVNNPRIIQIIGDGQQENTGSEIWMDDVTGDGLGDLLIARQNYTASNNRPGAGALTILVGNSQLLSILGTSRILDLRNPPAGLNLFTINGAEAGDRLGIWMRTGDVDGDGIHDIVVGADQDDGLNNSEDHSGSVYLIRGGNHLNSNQTIDLASFGQTALSGQIIHILPPENSSEYHFGATCQIADLDGNGRAEVLASAALNRAGAELLPLAGGGPTHSQNGLPEGTLYIAWDNLIPTPPWTPGLTYRFGTNPDSETIINGATNNDVFGEELLGGLDYDNDNQADLFIGDLSGQGNGISTSGIGYVFYNAANLKGRNVDMQTPPGNLPFTQFHGGFIGGIAGDTAMHGDMDGDGIADLAFSAPHGAPLGRTNAGIIHIIHGQNGPWPAVIDLQTNNLPPASTVRITQIFGANGDRPNDTGDV
ncbi:MAG: FG-GAP-like repeat-containing protein, partial [Gammaproteobacteria bacterium]|nr:FG-GAP-like repeat-containing protein [Gammaproteobacteria bacterium]